MQKSSGCLWGVHPGGWCATIKHWDNPGCMETRLVGFWNIKCPTSPPVELFWSRDPGLHGPHPINTTLERMELINFFTLFTHHWPALHSTLCPKWALNWRLPTVPSSQAENRAEAPLIDFDRAQLLLALNSLYRASHAPTSHLPIIAYNKSFVR